MRRRRRRACGCRRRAQAVHGTISAAQPVASDDSRSDCWRERTRRYPRFGPGSRLRSGVRSNVGDRRLSCPREAANPNVRERQRKRPRVRFATVQYRTVDLYSLPYPVHTMWPFDWRQPPPTQRRMCPERAAVCHRVCVGICSRHGPALQHRHTAQFGDGVRQPGPLRVSRCRAHASSPKP